VGRIQSKKKFPKEGDKLKYIYRVIRNVTAVLGPRFKSILDEESFFGAY